jgi:hypothetical protein
MAAPKTSSGLGPEFTYDLAPYLKVDPALIQYEEKTAIATGIEAPRGIAVGPNENILVCGDRAVRCFDKDGKLLSEFKTSGEPQCVNPSASLSSSLIPRAVSRAGSARSGTIYAGMKDHVEVYDAQGKPGGAWESLGPKAFVTSIAAMEKDVFVADAGGRVVLHYDLAGKLINRIGEKDESRNIPGLIVPSPYCHVALGAKDSIWVANPGRRRMECYTFAGVIRWWWGHASPKIEGFCGCCNPTHFAILPDGRFVTSEKGLPRVKIYSASGEFESAVAAPASFAEGTAGLDVAADSTGRVLVLDPIAKTVRIFVRKEKVAAEGAKQ